jgi:hypothetical protein
MYVSNVTKEGLRHISMSLKSLMLASAFVCVALVASGCSNSRRSYDPRTPPSNPLPAPARVVQAPLYNSPSDDVISPSSGGYIPSSRGSGGIVAQPLDEPINAPRRGGASVMTSPQSPQGQAAQGLSSTPSQPSTLSSPSGRNVADLRPAKEQIVPRASGTGVIGNWAAKDSTGASCRVQLSSVSAIDLNKASTTGCANKELAKVTAWKQQDDEIYLYQPGGTIAARLRPSGSGYEGVMTKSSAALSLSR